MRYHFVMPICASTKSEHTQLELFAPAYLDIAVRDQQDLMASPFCCLSKSPRKTPLTYNVGPKWIEITPNAKYGMATIYDHDILIWAASQIREAADRKKSSSRRIVFHPHALLRSIQRETGGTDYKRLEQALNRLAGTLVETNIRMEDGEKPARRRSIKFHLIDSWGLAEGERPEDDRWFIELPAWFYKGILNHQLVLSIHPDYFSLESGLDRFLYRIYRKHAGRNEVWGFTMRQLYEKSGSPSRYSDFALQIRTRIAEQRRNAHIPEYTFQIERNADGAEIVYGINRYKLASDNPLYLPPRAKSRRMGGGFTKNKFEAEWQCRRSPPKIGS